MSALLFFSQTNALLLPIIVPFTSSSSAPRKLQAHWLSFCFSKHLGFTLFRNLVLFSLSGVFFSHVSIVITYSGKIQLNTILKCNLKIQTRRQLAFHSLPHSSKDYFFFSAVPITCFYVYFRTCCYIYTFMKEERFSFTHQSSLWLINQYTCFYSC